MLILLKELFTRALNKNHNATEDEEKEAAGGS